MIDVSEQDSHWRVMKLGATPQQASSKSVFFHPANYVEQWRRQYAKFKDIPLATQVAVAALSMCKDREAINGIGMRVSARTFWLDDTEETLKEYEDENRETGRARSPAA